jgi:hypothetical protein
MNFLSVNQWFIYCVFAFFLAMIITKFFLKGSYGVNYDIQPPFFQNTPEPAGIVVFDFSIASVILNMTIIMVYSLHSE